MIDDLKGQPRANRRRRNCKALQAQETAITALEKRIKESKAELKTMTDELEHKLQLKRLGGDEFKAESQQLLRQVDAQLAGLDAGNKEEKKKITALQKDKAALEARLAKTDAVLATIGGQLTEEKAKTLILKKLYDLANDELNRYLNAEKRRLIQVVENLWDKYAVSSRALEDRANRNTQNVGWVSQRIGVSTLTIPIGWRQARLGEKCSIEIGGTPSRNIPEYWDDSKESPNLWVSIRDLNQRVITRTAEHISDFRH